MYDNLNQNVGHFSAKKNVNINVLFYTKTTTKAIAPPEAVTVTPSKDIPIPTESFVNEIMTYLPSTSSQSACDVNNSMLDQIITQLSEFPTTNTSTIPSSPTLVDKSVTISKISTPILSDNASTPIRSTNNMETSSQNETHSGSHEDERPAKKRRVLEVRSQPGNVMITFDSNSNCFNKII